MIARTILWRIHGLLRLFWSPGAYCPVPRKHGEKEAGRLGPILAAFRRYPALYVGLVLLALVAVLGLIVPVLITFKPDEVIPGARLLPPSSLHLFGTDALGR